MVKLRTRVITAMAAVTLLSAGIAVAAAAPASAQSSCASPETKVYIEDSNSPWDVLDNLNGGSESWVYGEAPVSGYENQIWCVQQAIGPGQKGYYFLQLNSQGYLSGNCLDVPGQNYADTQPIWVYSCNGTVAQRWCWNGNGYIVTAGDSQYALRDNGTGDVVTINNGDNNQWYVQGELPSGGDHC